MEQTELLDAGTTIYAIEMFVRVTLELTDGPKDRIVESIGEGITSHNKEITMSDLI